LGVNAMSYLACDIWDIKGIIHFHFIKWINSRSAHFLISVNNGNIFVNLNH
jgi:hypothetical protein